MSYSPTANTRSSMQEIQNDVNKTAHLLVLHYAGSKNERLIKSIKNNLKCVLLYSGAKLSGKFTKVKDKTLKGKQDDIVNYVKFPENKCSGDYT